MSLIRYAFSSRRTLVPAIWSLSVFFGLWCRCVWAQEPSQTDIPVTALELIADPARIIAGSDRGLFLYAPKSLKPEKKVSSKLEKFYAIRVSPNGKRVAVAGGTPGEFGEVEVFSLPKFDLVARHTKFEDVVTDVVWNSSDILTASSVTGDCCLIRLEDEDRSEEKQHGPFQVHSKSVLSLVMLSNGQIVSAGTDNMIRVWSPRRSANIKALNNHTDIVNEVVARPKTETELPMIVSVSDDRTARFWQPTIGRMVRFARLPAIPTAATWTHDGSTVIVGCRDGSIHQVDPETARWKTLPEKNGTWINDLVLSTDDRTLFVADQKGIKRVKLGSIGREKLPIP